MAAVTATTVLVVLCGEGTWGVQTVGLLVFPEARARAVRDPVGGAPYFYCLPPLSSSGRSAEPSPGTSSENPFGVCPETPEPEPSRSFEVHLMHVVGKGANRIVWMNCFDETIPSRNHEPCCQRMG